LDEQGNVSGSGQQLPQQFQPLCGQFTCEPIDACQVAVRPGEAGDKTKPDRILGGTEDNGNRGGCRLGRERRGAGACNDHCDLPTNQFGRQRRQPIDLIVGPAIFDGHVLALNKARVFQALAERTQAVRLSVRRCGVKKPDHRYRRLLRTRRERPSDGCRAAKRG
jgi:hypothetical protein